MVQKLAEWICRFTFLPHVRKVEHGIGYKLVFHYIPPRFINSVVTWDMTKLWKNFGLKIESGVNYWTIGSVINGLSTRYFKTAPEYQAWLGGYTVKLSPGQIWTPEDHMKLAVADQASWLRNHGDPHPIADVDEWEFVRLGGFVASQRSGTLYKTVCLSHSDVGDSYWRSWPYFYLASLIMAALMGIVNPSLEVSGKAMRPQKIPSNSYEPLKLPTYCAIFELKNGVHAVLYGCGVIFKEENIINTLPLIEKDLLSAMRSCEIVEI